MKHKHLSWKDRKEIEFGIIKSKSFADIAGIIGKDKTTVSKEIRRNSYSVKKGAVGRSFNDCIHKSTCNHKVKGLYCSDCGTLTCNRCNKCYKYCSRYIKLECPKLEKPPYVCNGCSNRSRCTLEKQIYDPNLADKKYRSTLSESRQGILATPEEIEYLNKLLTPLIRDKSQSLFHILENHKNEIMFSEKTIRSYINKSLFNARNIDLRRMVKFKPRKGSNHANLKIEKDCRVGRTYDDFKVYLENNEVGEIVETDTVIGRIGGKALLTMTITSCNLILAYLRDRNDSKSVTEWIDCIYRSLGHASFSQVFELLLTDNGSEFTNPTAMEYGANKKRRCKVFYCDPSKPYQKPKIENIHTKLRQIIPKGASMDHLNQEKIFLMCNHINSEKRKHLGGKTPYDMFVFKYGEETAKKLGLEPIPPDVVVLNPSLIK